MSKRRTPRAYQIDAVNAVFNYFQTKDGNPLVAMPTGTGKSVVIAALLEAIFWMWKGQRIMVVTHVQELIQQNFEKLLDQWPSAPAGINSSGLGKRDFHHPIVFAGIASVAKYWAKFGHVDLLLIDEAHLIGPTEDTMYRKFIEGLLSINPKLKVVGLTATPWRLGQGHLVGDDTLFTDVCYDLTGIDAFNRLIAEGYLAPLVPKRTQLLLDTEGVHMRGGEFIAAELQVAHDKTEITEKAVREALELGHDRLHWLVFCAGVEHAIHTAEVMNSFGIPTVAIHSKLTKDQRREAMAGWKSGKYRAATNNNVLTTGTDFPGIDLILMLRVTASSVLWVQMLGRGTRPSAGKVNCLVLDFAGNTKRLGQVNNPRIPGKKGEGGGEAPVKCCERCNTWQHAARTICEIPECAWPFPEPTTKLKQNASSDELISGDLPITEIFKVDHVTFAEYRKAGQTPIIKVSYYCNLKTFSEYVCVEHENKFAVRKARMWWKEHTEQPFPDTTAAALEACGEVIKVPTHLSIWINKKYPEIMKRCFDGSAFGTQEASDDTPQVQVLGAPKPATAKSDMEQRIAATAKDASNWNDMDDDIPF